MPSRWFVLLLGLVGLGAVLFTSVPGFGQNGASEEKYYLGTEKELMVRVHIWGEVCTAGEYLVPDGSTVLDLISKAGGPTEYASLRSVRLTHLQAHSPRFRTVNLDDYLQKDEYPSPPVLLPGDVVRVPSNRWFQWNRLTRIAANVATIAGAIYWYWQITDLAR